MKAAWYTRKGPAREVLELGDQPTPQPGPDELLIRVRASGVNPSDTKARGGARGATAMPFPLIIPHQDGAGEVVAAGSAGLEHRIGERVWFYEAQLARPFGAAAEFVSLPAHKAIRLPDRASFEDGACLGVPAMTAHRCVFSDGPVEGRTVLVSGGAGAVGRYAVQFAKQGGARVIATVGDARGAASAAEAGADLVLDRRAEDLADQIAAFTGAPNGRGVDRIVEVAFGANLSLILRVLEPNGVVAAYASDAQPEPVLPFWPLVGLNATVRFVLVYVMDEAAHAAAARAITEALEKGSLSHDIAARLELDRIAEAHELVERGAGGKVIVLPG